MTDLLTLVEKDTRLKRVARTNGGEWCGPCPFCGGQDRFRVWPNGTPKPRWWCRVCRRRGDAIDYLQERDGLSFKEAKDVLGIRDLEQQNTPQAARQPNPAAARREEPEGGEYARTQPPAPAWQTAARVVVQECQAALWSPQGAKARDWLAGRGLEEDTLTTWEIGYNPTAQDLHGLWVPQGIVIPCENPAGLHYLKIRRPVPPLTGPKYKLVRGSRLTLYGLARLLGLPVVVICEGELDALLLWQLAGDLVDVVAVGGAGQQPRSRVLLPLARSQRWFVALDPDDAGRGGASWWAGYSARVRQARPWQAGDLTDFHKAGGDLRAWVLSLLEQECLAPATLAELYAQADEMLLYVDGSQAWYARFAKLQERIRTAEAEAGITSG